MDLADYTIEEVDFSAMADPADAVAQWIENRFWVSIPWNAFPLFDFALLKLRDDRHIWFARFNHVIIDGAGRFLLIERVASVYNALRSGKAVPRSEAASFEEIVEAEDEYRRSEFYKADSLLDAPI